MSRASYGADVFSPVRGNASFNDDGLSVGRESDILDEWREPYNVTRKNGNSEMRKNIPYVPFLHTTDERTSKANLQSAIKVDSMGEKRNKKDSSLETDFTRLSYITTRNKSSRKSKKEFGAIQESQPTQNDKVSKTRKKNYTVIRTEADSNKELPLSKLKQSKGSSSSFVNPADSTKELPNSKTKQNKESSSLVNSTDLNKELPPNKMKQNKYSTSSSVYPPDSNKELLPTKIKPNKDLPASLVNPANSNKEILPSKIKPNNFSLTLVNPAESNKELLPCKINQNNDSSLSLVSHADSIKELSPSKFVQNKDSASYLAIPADSNKMLLPIKIEQNKDSFSPCLISLAFNIGSTASDHNCLGLSEVQTQTHKVLSNSNVILKKNHSKSKKLEKDSEVPAKKCTQIEKTDLSSDCEGNKLKLPEEVNPHKEENIVADSFNADSSSDSKPEQIQANIIEKLVKDAVSFEFDGIRQMLYLQHLQLLKYIDRNAVNCDLWKTIKELVEENRKLKYILGQQKT